MPAENGPGHPSSIISMTSAGEPLTTALPHFCRPWACISKGICCIKCKMGYATGGHLSRHRVIAAASPRMATDNSLHCQPQAFQRAVTAQCLYGILRACGSEPATAWKQGGDSSAIEPHTPLQHLGKAFKNGIHLYAYYNPRKYPSGCVLPTFQSGCKIQDCWICRQKPHRPAQPPQKG